MIRCLVFAAVAALVVGAAHADGADDFAKTAFDATYLAPIESTIAGTTPSDLLLDTAFSGDGLRGMWPPSDATWSPTDDGVQIFPWTAQVQYPGPPPVTFTKHAGYYVVGKQKNVAGDNYRAWIARYSLDGSQDTSFGTNGWIFSDAVDNVIDARIVGDKAYILANVHPFSVITTEVLCQDMSTLTGSECAGYTALWLGWTIGSTTHRTAAYGQKLAHDSRFGLYVAARIINTDRGQEVGIARLDAETGALVTGFGSGGYNIGLPSWAGEPNAEVSVNALLVTPTGYSGGTRLYVAGQMRRTATDHEGFILGLGPSNGATQTGWNWNDRSIYYENDNAGFKKDAVTALAIQRNGKIVYAGWSETDDPKVQPMIMGRLNSDGSRDSSFCAGNANSSISGSACLVDPPRSNTFVTYKPDSVPVAIAERRQNRDLVVVQRFQDNGSSILIPPPGSPAYDRVRALVQQFSANGNVMHARLAVDVPGYSAADYWSRPFAAWMGGTGLWNLGENTGVGEEVVAIVGTRLWAGSDYDATVIHLKSNDSIFADPFGGAHSD